MEAKFQRVQRGIEQHNSHELEEIRKDILENVKIPKLVTKRFDQLNQISEIELIEDDFANLLIPSDFFLPLYETTAIKTLGDGNCLFNSVSLWMSGSYRYSSFLRILTAVELYLNRDKYSVHPRLQFLSECPEVSFSAMNIWAVMLREEACTLGTRSENGGHAAEIICEAKTTAHDRSWSGMLDILALSSVLGCKIYSVYPDCNSNIRCILSGIINPLQENPEYKNIVIPVMWSRDGNFDNTPNYPYQPNHFVPLIKKIDIVEATTYSQTNNHTDTFTCTPEEKSVDSDDADDVPPMKKRRHEFQKTSRDVNDNDINTRSREEKSPSGASKYKTKFDRAWLKEFPGISMGRSQYHFRCNVCNIECGCSHMGKADVKRHFEGPRHQAILKDRKTSLSMQDFVQFKPGSGKMKSMEAQVRRAEVKVASVLAQHNIPLSFADHLGPLFTEIFPDSEIAKKYRSAKTKTAMILNNALQPFFQQQLVDSMKKYPYCLSIDGSNDTGLEKMNPLTVKIFDCNGLKHCFLDMCTTTGKHAGTAETVFSKMEEVLQEKFEIPWENCVALSVDNTNSNIGIHNSISTRLRAKNPNVYILGCPCHILHNAASEASAEFEKVVGFDVEDFCVDVGYWFDKSTNRKGLLHEFCAFCDVEYREAIKHCSTRWLSLSKAVQRILSLYPALRSYFLSTGDSSARFKRLKKGFADPMTEVYLYFMDSVLPTFTHFNLLLQRGEPAVHILHNQMLQFIKKLLAKFIKASELTVPLSEILQIDYKDQSKYVDDERLAIGFATKNLLRKLINDGDVTERQCNTFNDGVRAFLIGALDYATKHLPLKDEVLQNAQFVDVMNRTEANVNQVYYFVERFQNALKMPNSEINQLEDEFVDYQTMCDKTFLPAHILQEATVYEDNEQYIKDSVIWNYLSILKDKITGDLRFRKLSAIAKLVLTLPHSNADEERVFSLIRKNKILSRSSLDINNTLSSILTVKMSNLEPCYKYEPTSEVLLAAKKATWSYNQSHVH